MIHYLGNKIRLTFTGSCLKQQNTDIYTRGTIVNINVVYELGASSSDDPTLKNSLFVAVSLTKNADMDKYRYSGNGFGFDRK